MSHYSESLYSGNTIGLLGGGQLARMLALAAAELGFKTLVLSPEIDCPASQIGTEHILASYEDQTALARLLSVCNVITYEFENLPLEIAQYIEQKSYLYPSSQILEISQDRVFEKQFLNDNGIRTAKWYAVHDRNSLIEGLSALGGSGLLKTRRFGYDGKHQIGLHHPNKEIIDKALIALDHQPLILEEIVPFLFEISVVSASNPQKEHAFYDCCENQHRSGILYKTFVPSHASSKIQETAHEINAQIMDILDYVGVLCVEFFVLTDGSLLVNELAPRVHNSGHWTQKACTTSQFEQHIRAICALPLGDTSRHSNCEMTNLLGMNLKDYQSFLRQKSTSVHLYGKTLVKPERKMGHVIQLTGPATQSLDATK
ncbi:MULTISPECIES: 5-(carboxyamino)imidazole ribonucleotide synthase [unclassified Bartonella]|uniref:5-(carboxyamino)imidazole ribonucleotide synthase n=1 Tax=unclassified Bartonella TaxID=2645622 RepID=UPI00099A257A|nr:MULTISPECIES: 5-(carboxyamino)imidazole ribonucleotide synthase [unclassified Bartonella]AQX28421.1 5-(carboxyamino)imidazole ribonucleotide synthase [Bartonella sp. JB15]AQX29688.1 5-(carboxyamino)imidazole ribonucleotide synthase [Bartonella sp. JB63]